jgi:predicted RNA-binding protein YlxR (DUF448 family)
MLARLDDAGTDAGPRHAAAGTERLCVVTREVKPVDEMIRFVVGPDLAVVPDLKRKLPGRGVWVTARRDILATAAKRGAFARAFRAEVKVAPDLPALVEGLIERSLLDALAIARKARQVVTGHVKVEAVADGKAALAFLHASDGSSEGARQIMAAIRRGYGAEAANVIVIGAFTSAQLHLALARPNVVHAALLAGRASDTVLARWRFLARFRMIDPNGRSVGSRIDPPADGAIQPDQEAPGLGLE